MEFLSLQEPVEVPTVRVSAPRRSWSRSACIFSSSCWFVYVPRRGVPAAARVVLASRRAPPFRARRSGDPRRRREREARPRPKIR